MLIPVKISAYPPLSQTWNEIQITHWSSHSDSSCNGGVWNLLLLLLLLLLSRFSHVWLCGPHRRQPTRLPHPRDSPGKNTGVGCHFLLQGISSTQAWKPCLTHRQVDSSLLSHSGKPSIRWHSGKIIHYQGRRCKKCGFDPWIGKILWERKWQPTPIFLLGKLQGQRSLTGYSPWACKVSDTTEWLSTDLSHIGYI